MKIVDIDKHIEFLLEEIETLCDDGEDVSELEKMLEIAQNAKKDGRCYRVIKKQGVGDDWMDDDWINFEKELVSAMKKQDYMKIVAQYVSDKLCDDYDFPAEVCDGFYDWVMRGNYDEPRILCECEYIPFDDIEELSGVEYDKNNTRKLSKIIEKEVLFTTENFVVFSW